MLMCQYTWLSMWHENNILFWPLARSAFSIYHLMAEIVQTQYQSFIGCRTGAHCSNVQLLFRYAFLIEMIASLNSQLQNLPPLLDTSLNVFLLDFDFTSFFIDLTRNSHAFWIQTHRAISIVTLKFDDQQLCLQVLNNQGCIRTSVAIWLSTQLTFLVSYLMQALLSL